ncbi:uncharacterized protein LOC108833247 [Raphanus sativus]|uniref:Uncharacterized protein LOC108833247 n=1 Tax=Raphanus sativus TaxID=3726 RepID=A0A6J0LQN8_RAPSA|nr:uncharacterized protein LOC108833247 [Raphanus sativus]
MNLNKVFETMSMEEEEVPFNLPDLPQYSAVERNKMSIIGRTLNPECQRMKDLILDMPRKWQVYDRVRGVALSPTMFQFIFKYEHDLEEVLRKRVWTFNEWSIVIDRWMEKPPDDYLKYLLVWVQLRNIPVNHYTEEAITAFGGFAGEVDVVAFDPSKAQSQDYVRVRVFFDVSRPVRKTKVINLPGGGSVTLRYDFERIQKRCYHCQRLTHDKDKCPLLIQERKDQAAERRKKMMIEKQKRELMIQPDDPLFGVLRDEQVGLDEATGRRKINPEVLQNMREYLLAAEGGEKRVREERVKTSVLDLENDPVGQRNFLRLEPAPLVISEVDKDKGRTFDYGPKAVESDDERTKQEKRSQLVIREPQMTVSVPCRARNKGYEEATDFFECSTGFSSGYADANSSGTSKMKVGRRYRSPKRLRRFKAKISNLEEGEDGEKSVGEAEEKGSAKRRAEVVAGSFKKIARRSNSKVVPNGGLPNQ